MKTFIQKYKHGIPIVIYFIIYLIWFMLIEHRNDVNFTIIHMKIDDYIPFCEYFVIPYFCWFAYVAVFVFLFIFFDKEGYYKLFTTLVTGMTIFLVISTVWPNAHELRVNLDTLGRSNMFTWMIAGLYKTDTSTNLVPSIHVYNSIVVHMAVMKSDVMNKKKWIPIGSGVLCVLIVMSTVFIKQHSMFDVIAGILLSIVMYLAVYVGKVNFFAVSMKKAGQRKEQKI